MKKLIACLTILMALPLMANAQEMACVEVTGKVVDKEMQLPLVGSHIFIDEHLGTVSDIHGMFSFSVPISLINDNLNFSYIGYETESIPINEMVDGTILIKMQPTVIELDEVVVIANPWQNFRDIVTYLSKIYPDEDELIAAVLRELKNMDLNVEAPEAQGAKDINHKAL